MNTYTNDNKRIAKNTILLYIRMFLTMAISLYTSRIVLKELGIDDYGIYGVIGGIVVMLSFLNGAMSVASQRFIATELGTDRNELSLIFSHVFYAHAIIAIIVLILAETLGLWFLNNKIVIPQDIRGQAFWVYQCSIATFLSSVLMTPYNATIIAYERMNIYAYMSIIVIIGKLLIAYSLAMIATQRLVWYAIEIMVISILSDGFYCIYCRRSFKDCRISAKLKYSLLKQIGSFAGWSTLGSVAWTAKNQGINILLNLFFGVAVNAAYGVCNQVNTALNSFVQNFQLALNPQIFKTYSSKDFTHLNSLIIWGSKISFILIWIIALPVLININHILTIWLVDVPPYSSIFVKLIIIISILESFANALGTSIQATGKIVSYQIIIGLSILMNIPISWILLKIGFPNTIVFYVSIIISIITLIERIMIVKSKIPEFSISNYCKDVFGRSALMVASTCLIIFPLINLIFKYEFTWWCTIPVIVFVTLLTSFVCGLSRSERTYILKLVKSRINTTTWIK